MKKISEILIVVLTLGIGFLYPISNVFAETQVAQQLSFKLTIDKSIQQKNDRTVTVPTDQVHRVEKNGTLVINATASHIRYVFLSESQMEYLISQNAFIQIDRGDVIITIPAVNFSGSYALTLIMEPVKKNLPAIQKAIGTVYNFTLKWGDKTVSVFKYPVTISFRTHGHSKPNELKIYYWNEKVQKWELIGGKYTNGYVHANTNHFSIFGLFHPNDLDKSAAPIGGPKGKGKIQHDRKSKSNIGQDSIMLPKTATNVYNVMFIGVLILALGVFVSFICARFAGISGNKSKISYKP